MDFDFFWQGDFFFISTPSRRDEKDEMTAEDAPIETPVVAVEVKEQTEAKTGEKRALDEPSEVVKKARIEDGESAEYRYGVAPIKAE